jgi:hypothetical protein
MCFSGMSIEDKKASLKLDYRRQNSKESMGENP